MSHRLGVSRLRREPDTDRPLCERCRSVLRFATDAGRLLAWCPTCRTREPVPLIGQRAYDQGDELLREFTRHTAVGTRRSAPKGHAA